MSDVSLSKSHSLKKLFKAPVKNGHTSAENDNKTTPGPKSEKSTQPVEYSDTSVVGSSQSVNKVTKIKKTKTADETIPKPLPKVKSSTETSLEKKAKKTAGQKSFNVVAKKKEKSLTEAEYEKIFSAVLFNTQNDNTNVEDTKPKEVNNEEGKHKLPKVVDDDQLKVKKQRLDTNQLTDDSFHTPIFEDLAIKKKIKKKKVKKVDSELPQKSVSSAGVKTPPSKRPSLLQISPWGSHFAKLSSQGSSFYKPSDESESIVGSLFDDDDDEEEDSTDQDANISINKNDKKAPAEIDSEPVDSDSEEEIRSSQKVEQKSQPLSQTGNIEKELNTPSNLKNRLEKLFEDRNVGLWVYCSHKSCQKQRYMPHITDPLDLPNKWYCNMNPDPMHNSCDKPEHGPSKEEDEYLISNLYNAGSLVWARLDGYPWWPAMVDICPDYELYYWLEGSLTPTYYNVVFFDDNVTRAWLKPNAIAPYVGFETHKKFKQTKAYGIDYRARLTTAKKQAADAAILSTYERLKKYSFIARYKKPLNNKTKRVSKEKKMSTTIKSVPMKAKARKQQPLKGNEKKKIKDAIKIQTSNLEQKQNVKETKNKHETKMLHSELVKETRKKVSNCTDNSVVSNLENEYEDRSGVLLEKLLTKKYVKKTVAVEGKKKTDKIEKSLMNKYNKNVTTKKNKLIDKTEKSLNDKYAINEKETVHRDVTIEKFTTNLLNSLNKADCEMTQEAEKSISKKTILNQLNDENVQSKNNETDLETIFDISKTAKALFKKEREINLIMLETTKMKNKDSTVLIKEDYVNNEDRLNIICPGSPNFDLSGEIQNDEVGSTEGTVYENPEENEDLNGIVTSTSQNTASSVQSQDIFGDHDVTSCERDADVLQTGGLSSLSQQSLAFKREE